MVAGTKKKSKKNAEEKFALERVSAWNYYKGNKRNALMKFSEEYKHFLDKAKIEREAVSEIERLAKKAGFKRMPEKPARGGKYFLEYKNRNIALVVVGKKPPKDGFRIVAAHIDSPRLDLKQIPLYEEEEAGVAMLETHYYGGIKKFQWVNHPMAIHGVICLKNGKTLELSLGEKPDEPVFTVPDIAAHLSRKQSEKKGGKVVEGENLNLICGNMPVDDKDIKKKVKAMILEQLNKRYGIIEEDFVSADLEIVPAEKARDVGFDNSMVGAYGQDDKSCTFAALKAASELKNPEYTSVALFVDKEEIGSEGLTGIKGRFLELIAIKLAGKDYIEALANSKAISADTTGALNPDYKDLYEMKNTARLGYGVVLVKYGGSGGKYYSSEASAEFFAWFRKLVSDNKIPWQTGELGKVDEGGGGTIASYLTDRGIETLDAGPALISLHSPFEIASKADVYSSYELYLAFMKAN
ncbi:MAG: aminopeptidase [Candidatus Diapherotrites archaeon]|nr:aminopeptidase [Candidatus Diapherotrites archaeon]